MRCALKCKKPTSKFVFQFLPEAGFGTGVSSFAVSSQTKLLLHNLHHVLRNKQVWQSLQHAFCAEKFSVCFALEGHFYASDLLSIKVSSSNKKTLHVVLIN